MAIWVMAQMPKDTLSINEVKRRSKDGKWLVGLAKQFYQQEKDDVGLNTFCLQGTEGRSL